MTPEIVVVTNVSDLKQDKRERNYKTVETTYIETANVFNPVTNRNEMVKGKPRQLGFNVWEESYLDDKPEYGWDAEVNQPLMGSVVTRKVEPYTIEQEKDGQVVSREVDTYTALVLGNTTKKEQFEILVERAFKQAGHPLKAKEVEVEEAEEALANGVFQ